MSIYGGRRSIAPLRIRRPQLISCILIFMAIRRHQPLKALTMRTSAMTPVPDVDITDAGLFASAAISVFACARCAVCRFE